MIEHQAEHESLIMECAAHSTLWVFGLYEIVRVVKDTNPSKFAALEELFRKLEILRMPLAKHEVKSAAKYRNKPHYPTRFFPEFRLGWMAGLRSSRASRSVVHANRHSGRVSVHHCNGADLPRCHHERAAGALTVPRCVAPTASRAAFEPSG